MRYVPLRLTSMSKTMTVEAARKTYKMHMVASGLSPSSFAGACLSLHAEEYDGEEEGGPTPAEWVRYAEMVRRTEEKRLKQNFLYANNSGCDLSAFHHAIAASLVKDGTLPEELADLFVAVLVEPAKGNPDGTPRYIINAA